MKNNDMLDIDGIEKFSRNCLKDYSFKLEINFGEKKSHGKVPFGKVFKEFCVMKVI